MKCFFNSTYKKYKIKNKLNIMNRKQKNSGKFFKKIIKIKLKTNKNKKNKMKRITYSKNYDFVPLPLP